MAAYAVIDKNRDKIHFLDFIPIFYCCSNQTSKCGAFRQCGISAWNNFKSALKNTSIL